MLAAKPVDRHVIRCQVRADHPVHHVLPARTLDPPRGPLTLRIRVQDQRDHHRRLIRRATPPIRAIPRIEHRQIHLPHDIQQTPRQMPLGQPHLQRRRHQERLITVNSNEVLGHARNRLPPPGQTFMKQPPRNAGLVAEAHPPPHECPSGSGARGCWRRPVADDPSA